jgi:hypothetical protein
VKSATIKPESAPAIAQLYPITLLPIGKVISRFGEINQVIKGKSENQVRRK